jgi:hypothetical protein
MKTNINRIIDSYLSLSRWLLVATLAVLAAACKDDNNDPVPPPEDPRVLVDATLVYTISAAQVQLVAQLTGFDIDFSKFVYDVDIYKVTYHTEYKGDDIVASGLVSLPKSTTVMAPVLSYQHGTITRDTDAPSNFSTTEPEALVAGAFSSSGFVTVIPDYVGFGSTATTLHPYFVEDEIAGSVIDMVKAAVELADDKKVMLSQKLFLAGYSEGGYATMATHKAIEADGIGDLDLVASFPGAGAYDLRDMQQRLLTADTYASPFYLGYITLAYQKSYGFNTILTDFFQEPYATRMPGLFDNQKSADEINSQLTTNMTDLLQADLRSGFLTNSRYKYILDAFTENSLTDWKPTKLMFMYHGTTDTTVPFSNSQHTYDALIANGASPNIVSFTALPGDHSTAVTPYVGAVLVTLWSLM